MKTRSFSHRTPYYFKRSIHARKPGVTLKLIRLPLIKSQVKLIPILRGEDDGDQMTDALAHQSSQEPADQSEKVTVLAPDPILDSFHTKLLRIPPT